MVIGSILSIMLYRIFQQSVSLMMILSGMMEDYSNTLIFINQLERDCASVALVEPQRRAPQQTEGKTEASSPLGSEKKRKEEQRQQMFSADMSKGSLQQFSMVTTHSLTYFDQPGSWLVRVTYRLVEQAGSPGLFQLVREEAPYDGKSEAASPGRAYPVLTDIIRLRVTFYIHEFREGSQQLSTLESWNKEIMNKDKKSEQSPAPEFIKFEGACRSHARSGEEEIFSAIFQLPAVSLFVERQRQEIERKKLGQSIPPDTVQKSEDQEKKKNEGAQAPEARVADQKKAALTVTSTTAPVGASPVKRPGGQQGK